MWEFCMFYFLCELIAKVLNSIIMYYLMKFLWWSEMLGRRKLQQQSHAWTWSLQKLMPEQFLPQTSGPVFLFLLFLWLFSSSYIWYSQDSSWPQHTTHYHKQFSLKIKTIWIFSFCINKGLSQHFSRLKLQSEIYFCV